MDKLLKQKNGMTLLEIIIAVAIMGVIAVGLLPLFANSMRFVAIAGNRGESVYDAKAQAEAALLAKNSDTAAAGLEFQIGSDTKTAPGKVVNRTDTLSNGSTVTIEVFQPTN